MKKINYITMAAFSAIMITSCEKEDIIESEDENKLVTSIKYELNNIPLDKIAKASMIKDKSGSDYIYNYSMLSSNPDDADEEKINNLLFKLAEATAPLIKDINFNQLILNMVINSETQSANLLELQTTAPNFYDQINQNLNVYGLSLQTIADNLTYQPVAPNMDYPETAQPEYYVPAIFVPNIDIADLSYQPIISPNLEVNALEDILLEDNVIGWYYENETDEDITETLVDEESSFNTTNPLFFIDHAVTTTHLIPNPNATAYYGIDSCIYADSSSGKLAARNNLLSNNLAAIRSFSSREHRIKGANYQYESRWSGKSEFAIVGYRIEPNGTHHWEYSGRHGHKVISKISRSAVQTAKMQWNWSHHSDDWQPFYNSWNFPNYPQGGVNYFYWNTFERDWNRDLKALGTVSRNGTTIHLKGNMRYSSNWYAWIPNTVHIHNTQFVWIDYYWSHWNNSWKSDFRLWKVFI